MAASRRHWKFIVRDAYGYVIQNAKVNVYLPGTTTVFSGSAFNADSGGSAVTNPFTTNAQGEVEAWFDTAQVVDVAVNDNAGTAYRAVDGVGGAFTFSPFTEFDEIGVDPIDLPTTKGDATDLQDITAALQAEVVGASNRWADGAHVHGHVALAADPHGPAAHSNVTRQLWLPVLDVVNDGGTIATRGTAPDALRVLTLADAATSGMSWAFTVPDDWDSGALTITIVHAGQTTAAGVIRWSVDTEAIASGASIVGVGTTVAFTGAAPTTADLLLKEAAQTGETPAAAGDLYRVSVRRIGADAADTYAASTSLIGILVGYTANQ